MLPTAIDCEPIAVGSLQRFKLDFVANDNQVVGQ